MGKIGIRNKMNCGQYCEIINEYGEKIDVIFDDGNIVKNKYYGNFKKGQISNSKNKVGETNLMNCGLNATIIEYINYHNISIEFEDGYITKNKGYDSFIKGGIAHNKIKNPYPTNSSKRIGLKKEMNCGMFCEIIEYNYNDDITVKFDDGTIIKNRKYNEFKNGMIKNRNIKIILENRVGEKSNSVEGFDLKIIKYRDSKDIDVLVLENNRVLKNQSYYNFINKKIHVDKYIKNKQNIIGGTNTNKYMETFKIVEYYDYLNIIVEFDNGYKMKTFLDSFKNGRCYSPYAKTVYNIGYMGIGKYNYNGNLKRYGAWSGIFNRCYNNKYQIGKPTYVGCVVHNDWHNFQNFAKWYEENYYECGKELMCLDKDILTKGNKIYSDSKCIFVPQAINSLFTKCDGVRGSNPIGISRRGSRYIVRISNHILGNTRIEYGRFDNVQDAFNCYKYNKEKIIKQVADEYKSKYPTFPQKLYDAMYKYEVEITD